MSARRTYKVSCVQFAFSDDTVVCWASGRYATLPQTELDATSCVKHTKRGLPTSGHGKFIAHETGVNIE